MTVILRPRFFFIKIKAVWEFIFTAIQHGIIYAYIDFHIKEAYGEGINTKLPLGASQILEMERQRQERFDTNSEANQLNSECKIQFPVTKKLKTGNIQIAIIIPVLCTTLEHLDDYRATLDRLKEFMTHAIVCIDGPTPYIEEIKCLANQFGVILIINSKQRGAAYSRNRCLDYIVGHLNTVHHIVMLDCGVVIHEDWWAKLNNTICTSKVNDAKPHLIAGVTLSISFPDDPWFAKQINKYFDQTGVLNSRIKKTTNEILYSPTCHLIIPKHAFHIRFLENWFPDAGFEDVEYSIRCQRFYELPIVLNKDLIVYHNFRSQTIADVRKRYFRYGRNDQIFRFLCPHYGSEFENSFNFVVKHHNQRPGYHFNNLRNVIVGLILFYMIYLIYY